MRARTNSHGEASASDGAERTLFELIDGFSVRRAEDWLRVKFPSFDASRAEPLDCAATKSERDYFAETRLLGFVTNLPEEADNRPLVVASVRMRLTGSSSVSRKARRISGQPCSRIAAGRR